VDSTIGHGTRFRLEFPSLSARPAKAMDAQREALPA
jgi:hypothetical protein